MMRPRHGMLLLEAMLGIAILGMAGVALIVLLQQTVQTVRSGRATEQITQRASELMNRVILWNSAELDARVGRNRVGSFTVDVGIAEPHLYVVNVLDTLNASVVLRTSIYRPARAIDEQ